ncbi:MAG: hypothetical protein QOF70_5759 [Acetobacteraceae bacterium]|nr:hypothetical protein [Acetobacteraceae bacterium]
MDAIGLIPAARRVDRYARRVGVAAAREINKIPAARRADWYAIVALAFALTPTPPRAIEPRPPFEVSYTAGTPDLAGQPMGGTEIRALVAHGGKLFAANGYWKDTAAAPGAQILVLDTPGGSWRVDHTFDEVLPAGRRRHLAVSALRDVTFRSDSTGASLPWPVSMLVVDLGRHRPAHRVHAR